MSIITESPVPELSTGSLFFQLSRGKFKPNKLWECRRFRLKFLLRSLAYPVTTFSYMERMSELPAMRQALLIQGLLPAKIHRPYLCANFSVKQRAQALLAHYDTVQRLPRSLYKLFLSPVDQVMARLSGKNDDRFEVVCSTGRYDREGEITLVLLYNAVTIASLSFSFIEQAGELALLIGGLQGPRKTVNADIIRDATKSAHGLFPKRVLMETLFYLAGRCQVKQIQAVGDETHVFRSLRYRHSKKEVFHASYSEFWLSLTGEALPNGLYQLPLAMPRKPLEEIASKKRAEYRRRYEFMDTLEQQLSDIVAGKGTDRV
ncbi:VirK/YbjX family protein [Mixta sp. Marseille-Q2659]|uniref:VirK/YbjX family protein n=1 Tax=Mixta sp. Marseille-Q2659 TaxID=2736607 RepID=UPI0023B96A9C|nr:VirK/YbjX family protein [Mixta sp. Marseille-Q2659]